MAEKEPSVITAIKDIEQEGSLVTALMRIGQSVVYRATSPELLHFNLKKYPEALLLLSDDFISAEEIAFKRTVLIRGRSQPVGLMGVHAPQNDFELIALIRESASESQVREVHIAPTTTPVVLFTSIHGGSGTTTLAINVAEHLSQSGVKTLLVDADRDSHSIAEHFERNGIRNDVQELSENLHLFEVSEMDQLQQLASIASQFEYLVLDFGLLGLLKSPGCRVRDVLIHWSAHSHGRFILAVSSDEKSIKRGIRALQEMEKLAPLQQTELALTLETFIGRREREKLQEELTSQTDKETSLFSRDPKAIRLSRERATTLLKSSPRSTLNREIANFVSERLLSQ